MRLTCLSNPAEALYPYLYSVERYIICLQTTQVVAIAPLVPLRSADDSGV